MPRLHTQGSSSIRTMALSLEMARDEIVDPQANRPGAAILVVALEIDRVLAIDDFARLGQQEAIDLERACRPSIEDDAVARRAVAVGQSGAAFDPGLGLVLRGHRPAQKSLNLVRAVQREVIMLAVDLADEDTRPVAEALAGEGRFRHQMAHGESEREVGAGGPQQPQLSSRCGPTRGLVLVCRLQHGLHCGIASCSACGRTACVRNRSDGAAPMQDLTTLRLVFQADHRRPLVRGCRCWRPLAASFAVADGPRPHSRHRLNQDASGVKTPATRMVASAWISVSVLRWKNVSTPSVVKPISPGVMLRPATTRVKS